MRTKKGRRRDRGQNNVVLRNVGEGEEGRGSVVNVVQFLLFFCFSISFINCDYRGKGTPVLIAQS